MLLRIRSGRYDISGYSRGINKDCTIIKVILHLVECTGLESVDTEYAEK